MNKREKSLKITLKKLVFFIEFQLRKKISDSKLSHKNERERKKNLNGKKPDNNVKVAQWKCGKVRIKKSDAKAIYKCDKWKWEREKKKFNLSSENRIKKNTNKQKNPNINWKNQRILTLEKKHNEKNL